MMTEKKEAGKQINLAFGFQDVSAQGLMSAMKGGRRVMPGTPKKLSRKRRPPGILQFTPTRDMPDTLYYQVKQ